MRNVFCVWALCAMLFCVAPGLAGAAPQLNEEALRSVVISRLGRVWTENGQDAVARKLLSDNVRIDKYQPVRVGVVDLYAVQLSLHHPDGSSQPNLPDRMTLLTDASGTIQFGMVADLATGQEAALSQATEITRLRLPDALPKQLATGTGSHDVIFVSDPFCPFCRQAASYLLESLDRIASLKIVHLPLPMHPGADAATWIMEYATERQSAGVDPLAVMRYAYAQLRIPAQGTSPDTARKDVVTQFLEQFPALAAGLETSSPETFLYILKGKYEAQSADTAAQLQRLQITGTPFILVDGQSVRGFDKSRLEKLLSSRPHGEKEGT